MACFDAVLIIVANVLGGGLYQVIANGEFQNAEQLLGAGFIAAVLYVLIGQSSGFYELHATIAKRKRDVGRIVAQWTLVSLLLTLLAFLMKSGAVFSRGSIVLASLALLLLLVGRRFSKRLVEECGGGRSGAGQARIVLGTRDELAALRREDLLERFGLTEVERIVFSNDKSSGFAMNADESSSLERALNAGRDRGVDEIVLAFPWTDTRKLELVRDHLRVRRFPSSFFRTGGSRSFAEIRHFAFANRSRLKFSVDHSRGRSKRRNEPSILSALRWA